MIAVKFRPRPVKTTRIKGRVKKTYSRKNYNNDAWTKFMRKAIKGMKAFLSPAFPKKK
tara:strand:+ start:448 stop:621 length:174 start_codon:yes stop_codon:yes gene_type:complete